MTGAPPPPLAIRCLFCLAKSPRRSYIRRIKKALKKIALKHKINKANLLLQLLQCFLFQSFTLFSGRLKTRADLLFELLGFLFSRVLDRLNVLLLYNGLVSRYISSY